MNTYTPERVTLELSRDEFNSLIFVLGFAKGAAMKEGFPNFGDSALRLANAINRGNPDWTPYEVPEAKT